MISFLWSFFKMFLIVQCLDTVIAIKQLHPTSIFDNSCQSLFSISDKVRRQWSNFSFGRKNPENYSRENPRSQVGTVLINQINIVPLVGFEPSSLRWKARQDTTTSTWLPFWGLIKIESPLSPKKHQKSWNSVVYYSLLNDWIGLEAVLTSFLLKLLQIWRYFLLHFGLLPRVTADWLWLSFAYKQTNRGGNM